MNYEEKYKEVLANAKQEYNTTKDVERKQWLEKLFPELKESEDEKIRNRIFLSLEKDLMATKNSGCDTQDLEQCIAWLEKQGKQKSNPYSGTSFEYNGHTWGMCARDGGVEILVDGKIKERVFLDNKPHDARENLTLDGDLMQADCMIAEQKFSNVGKKDWRDIPTEKIIAWLEKKKVLSIEEDAEGRGDTLWCIEQAKKYAKDENEMGTCWFAERWLEKQGKEKPVVFKAEDWYVSKADGKIHNMTYNPADEVKQKFHEGEWIVSNFTKDVFLIKSFNNGYCTLEDIKGNTISPCLPPCESELHLWTIQDAKDGDVLVYGDNPDDNHVEIIMLFKSPKDKDTAFTYFHIFDDRYRVDDWCDCGKNAHPATKEQRDILFQKMKEKGYEWDADKKRLKKI